MNQSALFRYASALALLFICLATPLDASAEPRHCAVATDCSGGEVCQYGSCRQACSVDGDCNAAGFEACVLGACTKTTSFTFPSDYGLSGVFPPGCQNDNDCGGPLTCNSGSRCQLATTKCLDYTGAPRDALCPFGFKCDASLDACVGPTCDPSVATSCAAVYPVGGLVCDNGRCSSACTASSDCCAAGKTCPLGDSQNVCFTTAGAGHCVQKTATGRVVAAQVFNPDIRAAKNIIFVGEGFVSSADRDHFLAQAMRHYQYQTTHFDMFQALFGRVNVFMVDLPDTASGIGQPTLFGAVIGAQNVSLSKPGALEQAKFVAKLAVRSFAEQLDPTLTGLNEMDPLDVQVVVFYNTAGGVTTRAFSTRSFGVIFQPIENSDGPAFSDDTHGDFFVLGHEFGHGYGTAILDEYDSDSGAVPKGFLPTSQDCTDNLVSRSVVTSPSCDNCTSSTWLPNQAQWGDFINTSTFPSSGGGDVVGLFAGGGRFWKQEVMRSQEQCVMRQNGAKTFCPACREGLIRNLIPEGSSLPFRFIDLQAPVLEPVSFGSGPNLAVGANSASNELYLTRLTGAGAKTFSVVGANVLTRDSSRDFDLGGQLGGADLPAYMAIDESGGRVFLHAPNAADSEQSKLLIYSRAASALTAPIGVPGLDSPPIVVENQLLATRIDPASNERQLLTIDLSATTLTPSYGVPVDSGVMPSSDGTPLGAPQSHLVFFAATKRTPAEPFCDINRCEIWAFDTQTQRFLNAAPEVDTTDSILPGVQAATVGVRPAVAGSLLEGELLIAATDRRVFVWKTSDIAAGNVTPAQTWEHDMGGTSVVSAIAYSAATERVLIGNRSGLVGAYSIDGADAPAGTKIAIPQLTTGMQVRDIRAEPDGGAWVAVGGFSGSRHGLLVSLDLSDATNPSPVVSVQPVASIGLTTPAFAADSTRSLLYSNAVVNTGDSLGIADSRRYRVPVFRGFHSAPHRGPCMP